MGRVTAVKNGTIPLKKNVKKKTTLCPTLVTKRRTYFSFFFTELRTYYLSYSIYKHDATDIADPSSMQDVCHI